MISAEEKQSTIGQWREEGLRKGIGSGIREDFSEELTLEQRPERIEGTGHQLSGEGVPGRRDILCKSPQGGKDCGMLHEQKGSTAGGKRWRGDCEERIESRWRPSAPRPWEGVGILL